MYVIHLTTSIPLYLNANKSWGSKTLARVFADAAHAQAFLDSAKMKAPMRRASRVVSLTVDEVAEMLADVRDCRECAARHGADTSEWDARANELATL